MLVAGRRSNMPWSTRSRASPLSPFGRARSHAQGLLEILVRNPGKLVPQRQVFQEVWGPQYEKETDFLRVFIGTCAASST